MRSVSRRSIAIVLCATLAGVAVRLNGQSRGEARGPDLQGMDRAIKPGDDFFRFANGAWIRATAIPPDRASWGTGAMLGEQADMRTRALLEDAAKGNAPAGSDARKAGQYYAAYMNDAAIETRGLTSLQPLLDRIAAIADKRALSELLGSQLRADVDPLNATNFYTEHLFGLWIAQDFNQPTRNTAYLLQGGLGMPDREYYVGQDASLEMTRTKYKAHIIAVLKLAGMADAPQAAERIFDLETKIARVHWTREQSGDIHKTNTQWLQTEFAQKAPGLDWSAYFKAAALDGQPRFIIWQASAIIGEAALVRSEPLETWKQYLRYHAVNRWSNLLPKAFVTERFEFYGKALSGTPQMPDRWKRAIASTNNAMGDAVGQMYVAHYFPPEAKAKAEAMVADLKAAFGRRIDRLAWMSPQTKVKAKEKLQTLIVGVGYPDTWRSYSGLMITPDDALTNAMRSDEYDYRWRLAKLRGAIDRHEWWMTPQTVNAVNLPVQNALNFPAAILQPPFFDPAADAALNYGAIGGTIGHEISHSFDDNGSQFDAAGKLVNWWQPDDFKHFSEAAKQLVAQYNKYEPLPGLHVNGRQTLGENIADVAGLAAAYDAYRLSLKGATPPMVQGFSGDQRFFIAFAQSWRDKYREPLLRQLVLANEHSPSEYRADTVRNLDAWYAAFNVQAGQKLYLAPGERVRVW